MPELLAHHVPPANCPTCGHHVNGALAMQEGPEPPKQGDLSVCIKCAAIATYEADLSLRLLSGAEWDELSPELRQTLQETQSLIRSLPNG